MKSALSAISERSHVLSNCQTCIEQKKKQSENEIHSDINEK